jgi:hypothetical protein
MQDARGYVQLALEENGPLPEVPRGFDYPWGVGLEDMDRKVRKCQAQGCGVTAGVLAGKRCSPHSNIEACSVTFMRTSLGWGMIGGGVRAGPRCPHHQPGDRRHHAPSPLAKEGHQLSHASRLIDMQPCSAAASHAAVDCAICVHRSMGCFHFISVQHIFTRHPTSPLHTA